MRTYALYALLLSLFVLTGCREEGTSITTTTEDPPAPPVVVSPPIVAVTVNTAGEPMTNVTISGLGDIGRVNPDGSVSINSGSLSSDGTRVTVTSPGHWPEHRILMPAGNGEMRETFVMEPKVKAGEIDPSTGGVIELGENFSVSIPANSVVTTADGAAYDGPVEVYVNHDAPEDLEEMINSPGNYLAQQADGSEAALESYGMMDIALEAPDGTPLVLDENNPAEVRIPIKAGTEANAPDDVPFWVLDPAGFWLPAGTARLAPGCYVVVIRSSGGYNVDVPHPVTRICGRFVDAGGFPLTHSPFGAQVIGGMFCGASRVDCDGKFCINVAANVPLAIIVEDPCSADQFVIPIDPVDANTSRDIGDIVIDLSNPAFYATVVSCGGSGRPALDITEIWVNGQGGNDAQYFAPGADGQTVVSVVDCSGDDLRVQAFTNDYRAASRVHVRTAEDHTTQNFVVCGELDPDEFFTLEVEGQTIEVTEVAPIYWPGSGDDGNFNWLIRAAGELNGETYALFLQFSDPTVGTYADADALAAVFRTTPGQELTEGRVYVNPEQNLGFEGVSLSADGDEFEGQFTATMNRQNNGNQTVEATGLTVTATFKLKL